jgi:hypothetical protein
MPPLLSNFESITSFVDLLQSAQKRLRRFGTPSPAPLRRLAGMVK